MVMNHKPLAKPDAPPHAPKTFFFAQPVGHTGWPGTVIVREHAIKYSNQSVLVNTLSSSNFLEYVEF